MLGPLRGGLAASKGICREPNCGPKLACAPSENCVARGDEIAGFSYECSVSEKQFTVTNLAFATQDSKRVGIRSPV